MINELKNPTSQKPINNKFFQDSFMKTKFQHNEKNEINFHKIRKEKDDDDDNNLTAGLNRFTNSISFQNNIPGVYIKDKCNHKETYPKNLYCKDCEVFLFGQESN